MAFSLYTQFFGAANAFGDVNIVELISGKPAVILASATGGVINTQGLAKLDSGGNLSVYIDTALQYRISVFDGDTSTIIAQPLPIKGVAAPAVLNATSKYYDSLPLHLAAGQTITVDAGALSVLGAGVVLVVAQSGAATLAFTGGATKENPGGTSAANVTLLASGVYTLFPSPGGSDKWRLNGGVSI